MGSSAYRRIFLLGIAQPVMVKYFQVLEVHREPKQVQEIDCEKRSVCDLFMCFVNSGFNIQFS